MGLAARCLQIRQYFCLSARAFSLKLGISNNLWCQYELGTKEPGISTLRQLAAWHINTDWLITGRGTMLLADIESARLKGAEPSPGLNALSQELERYLRGRSGDRLIIWADVVNRLEHRAEGRTFEALHRMLSPEVSAERLSAELQAMVREGLVVESKGVYRLPRASFHGSPEELELRTLVAVQRLLTSFLPTFREAPHICALVDSQRCVPGGQAVAVAKALMQAWRSWDVAHPDKGIHPSHEDVHVVLAIMVQTHEDKPHES